MRENLCISIEPQLNFFQYESSEMPSDRATESTMTTTEVVCFSLELWKKNYTVIYFFSFFGLKNPDHAMDYHADFCF
jgi:predicted DNA-binding helix-hairpin-helix protein